MQLNSRGDTAYGQSSGKKQGNRSAVQYGIRRRTEWRRLSGGSPGRQRHDQPKEMALSIVLIGASGAAGSRILKELSDRGHAVTAVARHPEKIARLQNVTVQQGDAFDKAGLVELLRGHEVVVSSVR